MKVLGKTVFLKVVETPVEGIANAVITKVEDIQPKSKIDLIVAYIGDKVTETQVGDKIYMGNMGKPQFLPELQEIEGEYYVLIKEDNIISIL